MIKQLRALKGIHPAVLLLALIGIIITVISFFMIGTGAVMYFTQIYHDSFLKFMSLSVAMMVVGIAVLASAIMFGLYRNS